MSHRYNKDSPLLNNDYYKFMIENFKDYPKAFSTVEHGWASTYFDTYNQIEDLNKNFNKKIVKDKPNKFYSPDCKPFKFVFGTEAYWVKDRYSQDASNCHMVLLAKNDNGRKKLNRAIYESYASGYYYKNRMDLDILLSLPGDDVFVTTACLAFWQAYTKFNDSPFGGDNSLPEIDYSEIDEIVLKLNDHFTDFYLEVQANITDKQKRINEHILELHYKYGIPIIAGTDTHVIHEAQLEDRDDLLRSNHISYPEEEGWFMDLPTLKVFIERFQRQGVLNDEEIYEAINNTNRILYFEDIILDRSLKVPVAKKYQHLTLEERNEIFENILREEWKRQVGDINNEKFSQYIEEIKHDIAEVEGCHMADYFIDNYEIMNLGISKYGGILTPSGRGSGVSMFLNKLFGFTKVDKVNSPVLMYSERFLTKERVLDSKTPPDIDHNVSAREPFIQAQKDIVGEEGTFDLIALGTLKYKSAFKMYARAYNLDPQLANEVTKGITKYEKAMQYAEDDERDLIDIYDYVDKEKYGILIEGCQQYKGIVDNLKSHPCFTKNELVMTENGYKKISEIKVGDSVLTHDHSFKPVIKLMENESSDIYNLKIFGSPEIEVTGNHPFLVSQRKAKRDVHYSGSDRRELQPKLWKPVSQLEKGDLIGVAINDKSELPMCPNVNSEDNNFWWVIGRYLGDGWRSHTVRKSGKECGKQEKDVIICCNKKTNETEDIISHLDWCEYRVSEERTVNKIYIKKKDLYEWLEDFGDYADGKKVPSKVLNLPEEQLKYFLEGYFSADGSTSKKGEQIFSTVSKELALGVIACINKAYKRPCGLLVQRGYRTETIEGRTVKCKPQYIGRFHYEDRKQDSAFYKDGYLWYPYRNKEKLNKTDNVYNLEVEENHSYTVNNLVVHNCGTICYSGDAIEDIGVIMVKSESTNRECFVAVIESGTIDSFGYLKQDYLIVDSIGLTYEIYDEIGMEPMSVNQLLEAIEGDEETWKIYSNGHTMCINQCEQPKSTQKIMKYQPKNIAELTQWIAGIRPSFKSMYKVFENREPFDYGVKAFDSLIQDEYCPSSFILYQEQLMKVLAFAGFEIGETYTIIKAISKKKQYIIDGSKKEFIPNFAQAILDTNETNDVEEAHRLAEKVWKIVEDSAAYGFNSAHAYCMAIDSVTLAWLKAHYPLQFYKVCLQRYTNKGNKDKVTLLKKEMLEMGIPLNPIRFGDDNRTFSVDHEHKAINQTMASVKNMQEVAPKFLYELRKNKYPNIHFIFKDLLSGVLNKKSIDILIKLNYFKEYGEINRILIELEAYKKVSAVIQRFETCKQLNKSECEKYGFELSEIAKYSGNETPKMFRELDNEGLSMYVKKQYKSLMKLFRDEYTYVPATTLDRISYQVELMGYSDIVDETIDYDTYVLVDMEINGWGTPFFTLYRPYDGETIYRKVDRTWFADYPLVKDSKTSDIGKILKCAFKMKNKRMPMYDKDNQPVLDGRGRQRWGNTGEVEEILNVYKIEN